MRIVSAKHESLAFDLEVTALLLDSAGMAKEIGRGAREHLVEMNRECWAATASKTGWLRLQIEDPRREGLYAQVGDETIRGASDIYLRSCPDDWGEGDSTCMYLYTDANGPVAQLTKQGWLRHGRLVSSVLVAPAWFLAPQPFVAGPRSRLSPLATAAS